jgi:hypothetical protein
MGWLLLFAFLSVTRILTRILKINVVSRERARSVFIVSMKEMALFRGTLWKEIALEVVHNG